MTVTSASNLCEREADQIAQQIVQQKNFSQQANPSENNQSIDEKNDPKGTLAIHKIQRHGGAGGFIAPPHVEKGIRQARGGGNPLPESVRKVMEPEFGVNFNSIRIHTDDRANQMNQAIEAKAFTQGQDIFFRSGAFQPATSEGQKVIAHELTHTIQQGAVETSTPTIQREWLKTRRSKDGQKEERYWEQRSQWGDGNGDVKLWLSSDGWYTRKEESGDWSKLNLIPIDDSELAPIDKPTVEVSYDEAKEAVEQSFPIIKLGSQTYLLVGTQHSGKDKSSQAKSSKSDWNKNTIFVEIPPLVGKGVDQFLKGEIGDTTQNALARFVLENKGCIIGADGRKILSDDASGSIISMSPRNVATPLEWKDAAATYLGLDKLEPSIKGYMRGALKLKNGHDVATFVAYLNKITKPRPGTEEVLTSTTKRLQSLVDGMDDKDKESIFSTVWNEINRIISKDGDITSSDEAFEMEERLADLWDGIANLLLYTEVLASKEASIVIAYGAEHVIPLYKLLKERELNN